MPRPIFLTRLVCAIALVLPFTAAAIDETACVRCEPPDARSSSRLIT
jgi:hypothetical protein